LVDINPYCKARAIAFRRVVNALLTMACQRQICLTTCAVGLALGITRSEFGTVNPYKTEAQRNKSPALRLNELLDYM
jgi:hypothetical protein